MAWAASRCLNGVIISGHKSQDLHTSGLKSELTKRRGAAAPQAPLLLLLLQSTQNITATHSRKCLARNISLLMSQHSA